MDEGFGLGEESKVDDQNQEDGEEGDGGVVYLEHVCCIQWVIMLLCRMSRGPSLFAEIEEALVSYCVGVSPRWQILGS